MATKIDRKEAMRSSRDMERKKVLDRFDTAESVLSERPSGLAAPMVPTTFSAESTAMAERKVISVKIENVQDNPFNARKIYDPIVVKEMAASIATHGQLVPAPATTVSDRLGFYVLVDGHYRKKAAIAAGRSHMDLLVLTTESDLERYRLSWLLNEERSAQSPLDNALAWRQLLDAKVVRGESAIADMLGISPSNINKTLSLLRLPSSVIEKLRENPHKFGLFVGYELTLLAKLVDETRLIELVKEIIDRDLSTREVEKIRKKLETGKGRRHKDTSRQYKIRHGSAQIGVIKEWDSGKIALEIKLIDPKERLSLLEDLKRRFHLED